MAFQMSIRKQIADDNSVTYAVRHGAPGMGFLTMANFKSLDYAKCCKAMRVAAEEYPDRSEIRHGLLSAVNIYIKAHGVVPGINGRGRYEKIDA
jgi:hypothetical protein